MSVICVLDTQKGEPKLALPVWRGKKRFFPGKAEQRIVIANQVLGEGVL